MARRKDHTPDELTALIVKAAREILIQDGLSGISARKIAAKIGYSAGTIYQYFDGITAVVTRLNADTLEMLSHELQTRDMDASPTQRLHNFADIYLEFIAKHPKLWASLFELRRSPDEKIPEWYISQIDQLIDQIADCFFDGPPGSAKPRHAAELVWSSVHSVCSLAAAEKLPLISGRTLSTMVHDLVDIHLRAHFGPGYGR